MCWRNCNEKKLQPEQIGFSMTFYLSHTFKNTLTLTHTYTLSLSYTLTLKHTLSHTHKHTLKYTKNRVFPSSVPNFSFLCWSFQHICFGYGLSAFFANPDLISTHCHIFNRMGYFKMTSHWNVLAAFIDLISPIWGHSFRWS